MLKSLLIFLVIIHFIGQNALVNTKQQVVFQSTLADHTKSIVIINKEEDVSFHDESDVFFEIVSPKDISYTYRVRIGKKIGSPFTSTLKERKLIITEPLTGCEEISNKKELRGNVALMQRGACSFLSKVISVERAGAIAAVIFDNDQNSEHLIDMIDDGTDRSTNLACVFLSYKDGIMIKESMAKQKLKAALINIPLNLTFRSAESLKRAPWSYL